MPVIINISVKIKPRFLMKGLGGIKELFTYRGGNVD